MTPCACGCGELIDPVGSRGRTKRFALHHHIRALGLAGPRRGMPSPNKGKKASDETRRRLSEAHRGKPKLGGNCVPPPPHPKGWVMPVEMRKRISEKLRGPRSHLWRGGVDADRRCKRLQAIEWKMLRKQIYERDGWTCAVCRQHCTRRKIICHHIIPVREGGTDDPVNLITVCRSCHQREEYKYGRPEYRWASMLDAIRRVAGVRAP